MFSLVESQFAVCSYSSNVTVCVHDWRNKVYMYAMCTCLELPHLIHVFFISMLRKKMTKKFTSWKSFCAQRGWTTEGLMSILYIPQQWFPDIRVFFSQVILLVMRSEASFPNRESGKKRASTSHIPCTWQSLSSVSEAYGTFRIWMSIWRCYIHHSVKSVAKQT